MNKIFYNKKCKNKHVRIIKITQLKILEWTPHTPPSKQTSNDTICTRFKLYHTDVLEHHVHGWNSIWNKENSHRLRRS